ncbi:hypothetical protein E2C01_067949 [Portunus trituberculatus]|uniref:Uncharacterized protein n=1 Tax=Portunus trituberculatus TaxID=210409 RepID=A0A5B7HYT6_PORTR|nr:hypothetical protein [Portunus trituberculatus]
MPHRSRRIGWMQVGIFGFGFRSTDDWSKPSESEARGHCCSTNAAFPSRVLGATPPLLCFPAPCCRGTNALADQGAGTERTKGWCCT